MNHIDTLRTECAAAYGALAKAGATFDDYDSDESNNAALCAYFAATTALAAAVFAFQADIDAAYDKFNAAESTP